MTSRTGNSGNNTPAARRRGFTLVELLLVMTLLIVVISVSAPALASFFRGRTLNCEARRLLALTRSGQSRAVSEGMPMVLWVDTENHTYGLEAEPSYDSFDDKEQHFTLDKDLQIDVANTGVNVGVGTGTSTSRSGGTLGRTSMNSSLSANSSFSNLPQIRFLPDGSFDQNSLPALSLLDRNGTTLWLALSRNGMNYEIRNQLDPANGLQP